MRRYRRTTLLTVGCVAVLVGLGLSRKTSFYYSGWIILLAPILVLLKNRTLTALLLTVLIGLGLGLSRGSVYMVKLHQLKSLATQPVAVEVVASSDAVYGSNSQLQFTAPPAGVVEPYRQNFIGSFQGSGFGLPMVYRGDRVLVHGKIYPTRGANQAQMSFSQLSLVNTGKSLVPKFSRMFSAGIENVLPEPQASFGLGILIGQRINLPADITAQLTMVGLVHIVAVSGYNLTILVRAAQRLKLGSKYQQTLLAFMLIAGFVMVTGFSASIVRAAIISVLSLWAAYYGRQIKPHLLIAFTAALTALYNPFYVWSDLGWYLSFLAFFGVLIIAPVLIARFFKRTPKLLTSVLIETLCAELMTLPLIMAVFGQMSLIGLLANLLVVPLIPAAMLFSARAAVGGVLAPALGGWLAWPANLLLTYILDLVHILSSIPSIFLRVGISMTIMISAYMFLLLLVMVIKNRTSVRTNQFEA